MSSSGSCWLVKFLPIVSMDNKTSDFLDEYFDVVAINYTDDGKEEYVGYQNTTFNENDLLKAARLYGIELPPYKTEFLESKNWLKENIVKFAPVSIGDWTIYESHTKELPSDGRLNLRIYAATAFGSEHQTTKSCLQALNNYNELSHPEKLNILDMGTGSGILALCAALKWQDKCHITAIDIDKEAILVTDQNAADNHLEQYLSTAVGNGYHTELAKQNSPYDLILANILARPLIEMAPDLYKNLKTGGYCIISGFVDNQQDWVISEHTKLGLRLIKTYALDNWRAALLEKNS